jgi:dinuclear metal center YbgI/SA1388 family protein
MPLHIVKNAPQTVRELEQALFDAFPAAYAEAGDRIGLQVGEPDAPVKRVAVALDPTRDAIELAAALGCEAIVTHHPAYWDPPREFVASGEASLVGGAAAFAAARSGVAVIAMHTNLDAAPSAREMLLAPVGFCYAAPLCLVNREKDAAAAAKNPLAPLATVGQLGVPATATAPLGRADQPTPLFEQDTAPAPAAAAAPTLGELAERYREAFGAVAKVWGDEQASIESLAVCSGAGGCVLAEVAESSADCFVTGELRHHEALALAGLGIAAIELGHDVSELPYRDSLADALREMGFSDRSLEVLEPTCIWWTPQPALAGGAGDAGGAAGAAGSAGFECDPGREAGRESARQAQAAQASHSAQAAHASHASQAPSASQAFRLAPWEARPSAAEAKILTYADLEELTDV